MNPEITKMLLWTVGGIAASLLALFALGSLLGHWLRDEYRGEDDGIERLDDDIDDKAP